MSNFPHILPAGKLLKPWISDRLQTMVSIRQGSIAAALPHCNGFTREYSDKRRRKRHGKGQENG